MAENTTTQIKENSIQVIVTAKFAAKRSEEDKDALWSRCKMAIGQKCKALRAAQRANIRY